jgi:VWFA-related protein
MKHGLLPLLALMLLAGATTHGQQPAPPGVPSQRPSATFRTDINFVEIHAVVTDERGRFVPGLTLDDFDIFEDGRRQSPSVFEFVNLPVASASAATGLTIEPDVRTTSRTFDGRLFILVLDDLHTTTYRTPQVRHTARQFIEEWLGPTDMAAVLFTSGRQEAAQELTSSRRLLLASIDKFQGQKLPSASAERLGVHFRERETEDAASSSLGDGSSSQPRSSSRRVDDPHDAERGANARRTLELVRDVAQWLGDVKGRRKALVLFSEGIDYDIYDIFNNQAASGLMFDARDAIAAAQRANVSIYAVDPRGLTQLADQSIEIASLSPDASVDYGTSRGFQHELFLAQESLLSLAENTGGLAVIRSNDLRGGLQRIVEDNSRYYVLGYVSNQTGGAGRFRSIDVRVKRPGLKVRARRGYVPADPKAVAKRERDVKAGTSPALAAALSNPLPVGDIPVRVFAAPFKGTGKNSSVLLAVEVGGSALRFNQLDDRFVNTLEFSIVAADHQGKVRDSSRRELNLKLRPGTRERLAHGGVRVLSRLNVPPGRYHLRVGVHEGGRRGEHRALRPGGARFYEGAAVAERPRRDLNGGGRADDAGTGSAAQGHLPCAAGGDARLHARGNARHVCRAVRQLDADRSPWTSRPRCVRLTARRRSTARARAAPSKPEPRSARTASELRYRLAISRPAATCCASRPRRASTTGRSCASLRSTWPTALARQRSERRRHCALR